MTKTTITFSDGSIIIESRVPKGDGTSKVYEDIFIDRRCSVVWRTPQNPYYMAIYGLLDEVGLTTGYNPLMLLAERSEERQKPSKFFDTLISVCRKYHCKDIVANLHGANESHLTQFRRHYRNLLGNRKSEFSFWDCYGFSDQSRGHLLLDDYNSDEALIIDSKSQAYSEYESIQPEDLRQAMGTTTETRKPAYMALINVVCSWDEFPFKKPTNDRNRKRGEGYR